MSRFILDASYALTWCFVDRCTTATDETLKRLESVVDQAMVPSIWKIEVANALGKAVTRRKLTLEQAKEIWEELARLPISETSTAYDIPILLELAVRHNISVYDACYLQDARTQSLPLATNDHGLKATAESYGVVVMVP